MKMVKIHREGTNILILLSLVLAVLNILVWLFMPPWVIRFCMYGGFRCDIFARSQFFQMSEA